MVINDMNSEQNAFHVVMHERDKLREKLIEAEYCAQSAFQELDVIFGELNKVQEELASCLLEINSLKKAREELTSELSRSNEERNVLINAQNLVKAQFVEEELKFREEVRELSDLLKLMDSENEDLCIELHQTQEKLENYYCQNREAVKLMASSKYTMLRAFQVITYLERGATTRIDTTR